MNKLILTIVLFINVFANDIDELREEFYKNVVLKNMYKKYKNKKKMQEAILHHEKVTFLYEKNMVKIANMVAKKIKSDNIKEDEYFSFVDLKQQTFIIILYRHKDKKVYFIGSELISSGDMKREEEIKYGEDHYFETPTGIYEVTNGWRSDGKYKEKDESVQSYGSKGSFIYYFGKVTAKRYNTFDKKRDKLANKEQYELYDDTLNFAIHSYNIKGTVYNRGFKDSHGCVRLSDELNMFLDKNLVLYKNFYKNDKWRLKFTHKPKSISNLSIKGRYIFILDSL